MRTRTKIICTIGPAVSSYEKILELIDAGMNVARVNFSHGTHAGHKETIDKLKKARDERGVPLAIMLDTKGPEIRVDVLKAPISVERGQTLLLGEDIPITPQMALKPLKKGDFVLFDDGYIGSEVVETKKNGILIKFLNPGMIKSQKGVNMPRVNVPLPAMTEQDIRDIQFGCEQDVDLIAASFIRSAEHVREIKALLHDLGKPEIHIIAKIENSLGVENFDSILQVADAIMVARGDLGVELPIEDVPVLQKMMIRKCVQASKPVVTATQMLESMMHNPRPTRAEASDVANAIYDSTSAIMLSGETAVGKYPIQTVKLMRSIVEKAEQDFSYLDLFYRDSRIESHDISTSIAVASVKTAYSSGAKAIFAFTSTGSTARIISRFRPEMPIVALTFNAKTYHQLAFSWGVIPAEPVQITNAQDALALASSFARAQKLITFGDLVVVTAGTPIGVAGTTNMMVVESIGEVLVRGDESEGLEIDGTIQIILEPDPSQAKIAAGKILVLTKYNPDFEPLIKKAKAIILQNHPEDEESEALATEAAKKLKLPIIVRADEAVRRLQDGLSVTMDPARGTVYKKMPSSGLEEDTFGISDPRD
ncbi:MAG: pyruvate kinase [Simkaniaceae bacterium]|nr:pyruvate kinase [Candidatus Sacchlamyda saccharinae]